MMKLVRYREGHEDKEEVLMEGRDLEVIEMGMQLQQARLNLSKDEDFVEVNGIKVYHGDRFAAVSIMEK